LNHTDIIKTNYYNPAIGFKSASSMYDKLKQYEITKKEITDFIKKQSVQQQFTQTPHIKHYHPIKSNYKNQILQADLVDISDISRYNEGIKYLLIVIDIFSRFASAEPLKDKNASTFTNAMNEILKEITPKPEILITDNGSEFISKPFETLIKDNNISHDFANVGDHKKLGIVDRFVRTLRELINRYMIANKTNKYINVFQDLIFNYNNSYHRGIKGKPAKVAINSPKLIKIMKEKDKLANEEEQQFFVGDNVRYIKNKVMFEKGTAPKME